MGADGSVIQLVTRCNTADEFIERFARFTTATDVVVPAVPNVSVGTAGHFAISLKDGSVMMRGQCEVAEIRPVAAKAGAPTPSGPALMRLRLREMDAPSRGIHLRLMERHAASTKPPAPPAAPQKTPAPPLSLVPPLRSVPPPPAVDPRPAVPAGPPKPPPVSTTQVMSLPRAAPRNVPAPGPAVTAAALGSAATVAAFAPSAPQPEPIHTPRPETRAAGASFTLPANPLSDLDAADLASFVELTLLENSGRIELAPPGGETVSEGGPAAQVAGPALVPPAAPPQTGLDQARRIARRVGPYAGCLAAGLLLGIALVPRAKAPPPIVAAPVAAPPVAAPPVVALAVAEAVPPPAAAPPAIEESGTPAPRDCIAQVTTTPVGAEVLWGDIALGPSPVAHAPVPCGTAIVTFRRERYADVSRTIVAARGPETVVTQRMNRPPAKLIVTSSPPGAAVKFNKRRMGATPRAISFLRYEHVRLEVSSPGYESWKKTVYLKDGESKFDVKLARIPPPASRRSTAAAPARVVAPYAMPARPASPPARSR